MRISDTDTWPGDGVPLLPQGKTFKTLGPGLSGLVKVETGLLACQ